ncbi:MAG: hypothetical protein LBD96_02800 [Treponema sp.]|jgi:hypothetical protein|nr:hypothetical protein [Treponema sp.]
MRWFFPVIAVYSLIFLSCVSWPEPQPDAISPPVQQEPVIQDPVPAESIPAEPVFTEPAPDEPAPDEPVPDEPVPDEPVPDEPVPDEPVPDEPAPDEPAPPPVHPVFDYSSITEEVRNSTKVNIRELIGELNGIIRRGDFNAWVSRLDESYLARLSSREFLDIVSQTPKLRSRGEPLKDLEDYFINVVIPSRANTGNRVDDIEIEFIPAEEKVLAFRTTSNGRRERLYELKNIDGTWKIIN